MVSDEAAVERLYTTPQASHRCSTKAVRFIDDGVAVLSAVVGMAPAGQSELNPDVNAVRTLVARRGDGDEGWQIALLQRTPAQYHGRPEAAAALTSELHALLKN